MTEQNGRGQVGGPASGSTGVRPDVSDMLAVHQVLRDTLGAGQGRVAGVMPSDAARHALIADYYDNILWFLDVHHSSEEQLVFPKLRERSDSGPLVDAMEAQHRDVVALLTAARSSLDAWSAGDHGAQDRLADQLQALHSALTPHLDEEERAILPLCADHMSVEEWGALPGHALSQYRGDKVWLIIGLIMERRTPAEREVMLAHMPPPVVDMWTGVGHDAFTALADEVG